MGHMGLIILKKATCLDDPHRDVFSQNESHFSFVMHLKWPDVIRLSGLPSGPLFFNEGSLCIRRL